MTFEVGKQYQYQYHSDGVPVYTCVYVGKTQSVFSYDDGKLTCPVDNKSSRWSEVKPKIKISSWANVYKDGSLGLGYKTKEEADSSSASTRVACIHLEFDVEEGQGL